MRAALTAVSFALAIGLAAATFTAPAFADEPSGSDAAKKSEPGETASKIDPDQAKASVAETAHPVRRSIPLNGHVLGYTVTPGTVTIRDDEGAPAASIFYVAYVVDRARGEPPRPITFLFNGGPGSSTMWLHMGSFGPMKVVVGSPEGMGPAPYPLRPNPDTLLDKSDLVFIDAPTTGLSRALGKAQPKSFFGVDGDLNAFSRAIQRYLSISGRWDSPKFIIGESYGTLRAAGLAYALQERGVQLNGIVFVSSTLDIGLLFSKLDQMYVNVLPTYAAAAWYHNRVANKPGDAGAFVEQARAFAGGAYATALQKGTRISDAERDQVARQYAALTGLSSEFVVRNNLRVGPDRFRKELMRDQHLTVGRLDARFLGEDADAAGEGPEFDPTDAAMSGAFISSLNDYLFRDLGYQTPLTYRPNNYAGIGDAWEWKHRSAEGPQVQADTSVDLAAAMRRDPHLKVLSVNGLYDMATPLFGAEYDFTHMMLEPDRRANVSYRYYPSGHMVYIEPGSARRLKTDIEAFMDSAR